MFERTGDGVPGRLPSGCRQQQPHSLKPGLQNAKCTERGQGFRSHPTLRDGVWK